MASSSGAAADAGSEGSGDTMEVTVKTLDGQNRTFTVEKNMTVPEFKEKISGPTGIPANVQRLIFQGRVMQNEKGLKDYDVSGKVIHLVHRAPPSSLTGPTTPSQAPPQPRTIRHEMGGGGGHLDVQIHVGRLPGAANRGAHGRIRNVDFNLQLMNEALDLLEERANLPWEGEDSMDTTEGNSDAQGINTPQGTPPSASVSQHTQPASRPDAPSASEANAPPSVDSAPPPSSASNGASGRSQGGPQNGQDDGPLTAVELAAVMDRVLSSSHRIQPHLRLYRNYLRAEENYAPDSQELRQAQEIFNRVSEAMHALAHTLHSLSDLVVDATQPSPRHATAPAPVPIPVAGTQTMAIPIQMNVRARRGTASPASRSRNQSPAAAARTPTTAATAAATAAATNAAASTAASQTASFAASNSSGSSTDPPRPAAAPAGQPQLVQATFDITGGSFRLNPSMGAPPPMLPPGHPVAGADPSLMMVVVNDVQGEGQQGPVSVQVASAPLSSQPPATATPPSTTVPSTAAPPSATDSSSATSATATSGTQASSQPSHNVFSGGAPPNLPPLPNVPGMPPGVLQNILGSVLQQHGLAPGQPVRMNIVSGGGPPPPASGAPGAQPRPPQPQVSPLGMPIPPGHVTLTNIQVEMDAPSAPPPGGVGDPPRPGAPPPTAQRGTSTGPPPPRPPHIVHMHRGPPPPQFRGGVPLLGGGPLGGPPGARGPQAYTDPFLPCNSHHYNSETARRLVQRMQQQGQGMPSVPNLSSMVSGLVGDLLGGLAGGQQPPPPAQPSQPHQPPAQGSPATGPSGPAGMPGNPLAMLASLMGQGGVGGGAGGPRGPAPSGQQQPAPSNLNIGNLVSSVLTPLLQGNPPGAPSFTGPSAGGNPGAGTLADLFSQFRQASGQDGEEMESGGVLVSLLEHLSGHIEMGDLLQLVMGHHRPLARLRAPLAQYLNGQLSGATGMQGLVDRCLLDIRPQLEHIQGLVEVRPGVNYVASMERCISHHLNLLLSTALIPPSALGDEDWSARLYGQWMTSLGEEVATAIHCLARGETGFQQMLRDYMPHMTQGMNPAMTMWLGTSLTEILSSFHRAHPVSTATILPYIVDRQDPPTPRAPASTPAPTPAAAAPVTPARSQVAATPMEVSPSPSPSSKPPKAKVPRSSTSDEEFSDAAESLPEPPRRLTRSQAHAQAPTSSSSGAPITPQADASWQALVPREWLPVIQQDSRRQRQAPHPPRPLSDAYMQGLPPKRRRMMGLESGQSQLGDMPAYLPSALARAARRAGREPVSSLDNMAAEARDHQDLQAELDSELGRVLAERLSGDPDHSQDRFPNSESAFRRSRRH